MYVYVCSHLHLPWHMCGGQRELVGVGPHFTPCGLWEANSGRQPQWQAPPHTELSHHPHLQGIFSRSGLKLKVRSKGTLIPVIYNIFISIMTTIYL